MERVLKEKITDVARCVQAEEIGQLPQLKYEINRLLAVKYKKDDAPENESDLLKAQKQQLEAQLGASKEELTAPIAGVYSSVVDGYEAYLNYNAAPELTPEDFTGLENLNPEPPKTPACKVIDNFAWRIVILVPAESVEQVSVGGSVRLRFNSVSQNLYSAKVLAKNESGKSAALVLECTEELVELADKRRLDVDLVFERYEGYQIPLKAVHIKDGKEGVYIQSGGATKFREITVLYKNDSFVIALSDNQKENNVLLYDEIILSDKGIPADTP